MKRRKISIIELAKTLVKRTSKGEAITYCEKCKSPQLEQECHFCPSENIQQKEIGGYWDKERLRVENLALEHFKNLKLNKNEISEFLENKGKIFKIDYDFEVSNIKGQSG